MKLKLPLVTFLYVLFFLGCSTEEPVNNFVSKPPSLVYTDTVSDIVVDTKNNVVNTDTVSDNSVNNKSNIVYVPQSLNNLILTDNNVIAHRGAWKKRNLPQNSIASLMEAIRSKYYGAEFDIILTADDSLVVSHDLEYNKLDIQKSKYTDLINLNLSNGEKLPTLREYILAGKQNNTTTKLFCELKNYSLPQERRILFVQNTLLTVEKLKAHQLMVYISFDYNIMKQIRAIDPFANIEYLSGNITPEQLKADKISGIDYNISVYKNNPEWIINAKKNNVTLNVWTVNQDVEMKWAIDNKFDFVTTDEPELFLSKK
ncbi:glycerophosphodiester phosphodiesterase family protein [Flavobacterium sp. LHD-80]|uniref:glycerophosphodiester phosphodiesterase family protein n=1 Tax=Flavobacterium sp. LHD-80 TaxID=3071411 RepID=UPI0027DFC694|nr:glycerophosphodiester phosphodiesterase family protein [Flavobacterium sp. LHD-80]MDQ6471038.1 glycerophosphodiester phosphodiesterase family protein [Flavobacterium sp. LHD-80]